MATVAPQMKRSDYQRLQSDLKGRMKPLMGRVKPQPMEKIAEDPVKAAEWFQSQGVFTESA